MTKEFTLFEELNELTDHLDKIIFLLRQLPADSNRMRTLILAEDVKRLRKYKIYNEQEQERNCFYSMKDLLEKEFTNHEEILKSF